MDSGYESQTDKKKYELGLTAVTLILDEEAHKEVTRCFLTG